MIKFQSKKISQKKKKRKMAATSTPKGDNKSSLHDTGLKMTIKKSHDTGESESSFVASTSGSAKKKPVLKSVEVPVASPASSISASSSKGKVYDIIKDDESIKVSFWKNFSSEIQFGFAFRLYNVFSKGERGKYELI